MALKQEPVDIEEDHPASAFVGKTAGSTASQPSFLQPEQPIFPLRSMITTPERAVNLPGAIVTSPQVVEHMTSPPVNFLNDQPPRAADVVQYPTYTIAHNEAEVNSKFMPKKYRCRFCVYKTSYKSDLNRHLRKHGLAMKHCPLCNMPFKTTGNLENHVRHAHGEVGTPMYCAAMGISTAGEAGGSGGAVPVAVSMSGEVLSISPANPASATFLAAQPSPPLQQLQLHHHHHRQQPPPQQQLFHGHTAPPTYRQLNEGSRHNEQFHDGRRARDNKVSHIHHQSVHIKQVIQRFDGSPDRVPGPRPTLDSRDGCGRFNYRLSRDKANDACTQLQKKNHGMCLPHIPAVERSDADRGGTRKRREDHVSDVNDDSSDVIVLSPDVTTVPIFIEEDESPPGGTTEGDSRVETLVEGASHVPKTSRSLDTALPARSTEGDSRKQSLQASAEAERHARLASSAERNVSADEAESAVTMVRDKRVPAEPVRDTSSAGIVEKDSTGSSSHCTSAEDLAFSESVPSSSKHAADSQNTAETVRPNSPGPPLHEPPVRNVRTITHGKPPPRAETLESEGETAPPQSQTCFQNSRSTADDSSLRHAAAASEAPSQGRGAVVKDEPEGSRPGPDKVSSSNRLKSHEAESYSCRTRSEEQLRGKRPRDSRKAHATATTVQELAPGRSKRGNSALQNGRVMNALPHRTPATIASTSYRSTVQLNPIYGRPGSSKLRRLPESHSYQHRHSSVGSVESAWRNNPIYRQRSHGDRVLRHPPASGRYAQLVSDFDKFSARPYACALCFFRTANLGELRVHCENHLTGCNTRPIPETAHFSRIPMRHRESATSPVSRMSSRSSSPGEHFRNRFRSSADSGMGFVHNEDSQDRLGAGVTSPEDSDVDSEQVRHMEGMDYDSDVAFGLSQHGLRGEEGFHVPCADWPVSDPGSDDAGDDVAGSKAVSTVCAHPPEQNEPQAVGSKEEPENFTDLQGEATEEQRAGGPRTQKQEESNVAEQEPTVVHEGGESCNISLDPVSESAYSTSNRHQTGQNDIESDVKVGMPTSCTHNENAPSNMMSEPSPTPSTQLKSSPCSIRSYRNKRVKFRSLKMGALKGVSSFRSNRPFRCGKCGKGFSMRLILVSHVKTSHCRPLDTQQNE